MTSPGAVGPRPTISPADLARRPPFRFLSEARPPSYNRPALFLRLGLALLVVLGPRAALAQEQNGVPEAVDLQLFHPAVGAGGWISIEQPTVPSHLAFTVGLAASWATGVLQVDKEGETHDLVPWAIGGDLTIALGLFQFLQIGIDLPLQSAEVLRLGDLVEGRFDATTLETAVGDPRFLVEVPLLRGRFRLAALLDLGLPLGASSRWIGSPRYVLTPTVLAAGDAGPVVVSGSVGWSFRQEHRTCDLNEGNDALACSRGVGFEVDDELALGAGVRAPFARRFGALAEVIARIPAAAPVEAITLPIEARLGVDATLAQGLTVFAGVGRGLSEGYGTPGIRAIVGARQTFEPRECAYGPEDDDGFEDGDFCRDPDNDEDGVLDERDACPNDAEDADGFADRDGCPDPDNDADGIADAPDRCPLAAEDRDGLQDEDGCPDDDNDQDHVADWLDSCPMDPEDADSFEDDDGCPEPGPTAGTVTVTETRILISERIFFDYDRDTIRPVSLSILDSVAQVIRDTPHIRQVRIEGYTDSVGDEQYNLDLSYRRARAVLEYLVSKGVERPRLSYIGYGEQSPIADNGTPEGQALNRRVEFTIVGQQEPQATPPRQRRGHR